MDVSAPDLGRSTWFRAVLLACALLFAASVGLLVLAPPANSVDGTAGAVAVTVAPTSGLADGQTIAIHAAAQSGDLFEIRAHLCLAGAAVENTVDFDFDGPNCSPTAVSPAADYETIKTIPAGTGGSGDLTFKVGVGSGQPWGDMFGGSHTLTCGPGAPCTLVVQLQVTDATVFYAAPLCFGADCPASDGGSATPPPPAAAGPGGDSAASAASSGRAVGASGAASPPAASTPAGASATGTGKAPSEVASPAGPGASGGGGEDIIATLAGSPVARRAARVFAGGVAGAIGGCLIAAIIIRGRRRMSETRTA